MLPAGNVSVAWNVYVAIQYGGDRVSVILSTIPLNEEQRQRIMSVAPGYEVIPAPRRDRDKLREVVSKTEIWFGGGIRPDLFAVARRLKWIQAVSAGVDSMLFPEMKQSGVIITNVRGMQRHAVADHTILLMLALARRLRRFIHLQAAGQWHRYDDWMLRSDITELKGSTIGIIGLGRIGQEIAGRAKAFHMNVIGTNTSGRPVPNVDTTYGPDGLEAVIRAAQWLVIAAPLTETTRNMIGERELSWLGPDGYLINIARGGLVDQSALIKALQTGQIAGAGLDVATIEPLPEDSPLWYLPNVIITPHMAASMRDYVGEALNIFCDNLKRYLNGQPLINEVNKDLGY